VSYRRLATSFLPPQQPSHQSTKVANGSALAGAPNDEVINGHPLYGRGLVAYGAHTVERSRWIREQEKINSVHPQHRPGWEARYRHYVLAFHDETFECIACAHTVKAALSTFADALQQCAREVITR